MYFAYFIWDNFERMSAKQYALMLLPSDLDSYSPTPSTINVAALTSTILLCLKQYRAASEGWRYGANCDTFVESYESICVPGVAVHIRRIALVGYVYVSPLPLRFGARCLHENGPGSLGVRTDKKYYVRAVCTRRRIRGE